MNSRISYYSACLVHGSDLIFTYPASGILFVVVPFLALAHLMKKNKKIRKKTKDLILILRD